MEELKAAFAEQASIRYGAGSSASAFGLLPALLPGGPRAAFMSRLKPLTWGFGVELRGIEPLTSSMPWKRSTN